MIKILLNTVIRSFYKQKAYSLINVFGLAIGVTCTLLILIWVDYETSYDQFHEDIDQVYSVYENQTYADGDIFAVYSTPAPLAASLQEKHKEITHVSRMTSVWGKLGFSVNGKKYIEKNGKVVDADFFSIFTFPLLDQLSDSLVWNRNSIVLTESFAKKLFGTKNALGKSIQIDPDYKLKVIAIVSGPPDNSSIKFDYLLSFEFFREYWEYNLNDWDSNSLYTFIKTQKGVDEKNLAAKIKHHVKEHLADSNVDLALQAYEDYHLHSISPKRAGPIWYVQVFVLIAILILLIACFNYMNLATARSEQRAREVAVRKVVGAQRSGLISLFVSESIVFTTIALALAIVMVELLLPIFSDIIGRELSFHVGNYKFLLGVICIVFFTGLFSGSYPALFLSSFKPIQVIRGKFKRDSEALRKILVVIQFCLLVALFICSCIIYKQLNFLKDSDIGFNKNNIVYVELLDQYKQRYPKFKEELQKTKGVFWVTAANQMPVNFKTSTWDIEWPGKTSDAEEILFRIASVDFDFVETFEMEVLQGRAFSKQFGEDTTSFIINETASRKMGMEYTIGEEITLWGYTGKVVGIVKDFNFNSLQVGVKPLILMRNPESFRYVGIRVDDNVQVVVNRIHKIWNSLYPDIPFNYRLLEEDFGYFYKSESRMSKIFVVFTLIALLISSLGLFGLVSFITERKTKEMALRKVFGADISKVSILIVRDILKWILLANGFAWTLSYFLMEWWLTGFAYRISIGLGVFVIALFISIVIALLTIYQQVNQIAKVTPAEILKYE